MLLFLKKKKKTNKQQRKKQKQQEQILVTVYMLGFCFCFCCCCFFLFSGILQHTYLYLVTVIFFILYVDVNTEKKNRISCRQTTTALLRPH